MYVERIIIKLFIIRGDYLIKYIFIIAFICLVYVVIFALLKTGSDFDDEVEEFYNNFYEDDGLNEEYDYYDNRYKEIIDKHKEIWYKSFNVNFTSIEIDGHLEYIEAVVQLAIMYKDIFC